MKRLVFRRSGPPAEVLECIEDSAIAVADGEVRVRIEAAPINPADLNTIEGTYGVKLEMPATPGIEGCGRIVESKADGFDAGDRVIFLKRSNTWASEVVVPANVLFKVPGEIDPLQAAMLKVNPATAWRLLHGFGALKQGDWIVQNAGNSAVSRCVIQLARDLGISTISFVRRSDVIDELMALGADHVFIDDDAGLVAAKEVLGGSNAALAFNAVGGDSALRLMKLLRQGGKHITYGAMGRKPVTVPNGLLIFGRLEFHGLWITRWIDEATDEEVRETYTQLARRVVEGTLRQPVEATFALEQFPEALARLDAGGRNGKVLFVP